MNSLGPPERQKGVLEQIKLKTLLEAKMIKLKLSYFGHIMRKSGFFRNVKNAVRNKSQQEKRMD